ncbi:putative glutaredoxin-like domain (DUF836) [Lyophyllum shimeji]|uniref:Glutaredoxin-like domain (DUF836) n=1 Tax=Lyophyllum shimeji TaxID=47721 RepID=A0A9P3UKL9_LYOSH|nr:putative glutaredoxin-like domain (DUF836) [Lyophyllum shimeji]
MAGRLARLPRLTLFSGPNCSLCDIAKAELAKVRQTRPFELETINIQDPGQEKWKKKYVYWIPALHLEGKEIAKGRWDAQTVYPALDKWQKENMENDAILGDEQDAESPTPDSGPTCFNCGEPNHVVAECPRPVNRQLVALSRQFHAFLKAERRAVDFKRIHEVEAWRQQRLEWLDIFEPGEIRGQALRDALGDNDGEWLANMAVWGYPRGWVSVEDPREKVRRLIWDENCDGEDEEPEPFLIYGDDDDVETVHADVEAVTLRTDEGEDDGEESNGESDTTSTISSTASSPALVQPIRWATYPPSHFSSQLLPVYNGFALPPISGHQGSATYTADRHELWQRIITGPAPSSGWSSSIPPPPPTTPPPPIPPPPPSEPPPPLSPASPPLPAERPPSQPRPPPPTYDPADDEEVDMDMSD